MGAHKKPKRAPLIDATAAFQKPKLADVQFHPEMKSILEGLGQAVLLAREQVRLTEARFNQYILQCADTLKIPMEPENPQYVFDPNKVAFVENVNFKEPDAGTGGAAQTA